MTNPIQKLPRDCRDDVATISSPALLAALSGTFTRNQSRCPKMIRGEALDQGWSVRTLDRK